MKKESFLFSSTNTIPNINVYQQMGQEFKRVPSEYVFGIYQIYMEAMFHVHMGDDTSCFFLCIIGVKHGYPLSFELEQMFDKFVK